MSNTGDICVTYAPKVCLECGGAFYKPSKYTRGQWRTKRFCSNACAGRARRTEGAVEGGYWIMMTDRGRRPRSHVVMEEEIGRALRPGEVVDHENGDTLDDRPSNLRLFASNAAHMAAHFAEGTLVPVPGGGSRRCR